MDNTQGTPPRIGAQWPEQGHCIYAGIVRGNDDEPDYHLLVHPDAKEDVKWNDAMQWASDLGASLPLRKEQAILFGNVPELFEPDWYWSGEQYASDDSYAWDQNFDNGLQYYNLKTYEGRARAVRRLLIIR